MVLVVVLELGLVGVLIVVLMVGVVGDVSKLWWLPCHLVVLVSVLVMVWVVLAMSSLVGVFFCGCLGSHCLCWGLSCGCCWWHVV